MAVTRFAEDRRGRVPFALVGIVLLVGASTFGAAISTQGPDRVDRGVDAAMERSSAEATAALRSGVAEAAREAAAEPVTAPAETPYGRLLSDSTPFRDALRLRIYLRVQERLSVTRYRRGDVTAAATLPEATTPAELQRGMERIEIRGVENGTALRVTVRNLTVTALESGRVVASERRDRTVTVSTPVLTLHDRATAFETRLNRGPLDGPGLGRRLSARLYPIAWARGYAQHYGTAPIANVVANRHVELSTNGAVLEAQREAFGRSDPEGREAMQRARLEFGVKEFAAGAPVDSSMAERVLPRPNAIREPSASLPPRHGADNASPNRRLDVDVGTISGRALAGLRTDSVRSNRSLREVLRAAYRVEAKLRTTRRQTYAEPRPEFESPGEGWSLVDTDESANPTVESSVGPTPDARAGERRFDGFARHVELDRRVTWTWRRGNETRTTGGEWTERYRVGVTLVGRYAPNGTAPDRPTRPRFERGGPLDGPNLANVSAKASRRLVDEQGGRDAVAAAVAARDLDVRKRTVYGDRPADLRSWTNENLTAFRGQLANVSVSVSAGRVATYTTNPPERLAAELRRRRATLIDAPNEYYGAADRGRYGARAALLDETIRRLERRSANHNETQRAFDAVLHRVGVGSTERLHDIFRLRNTPTPIRQTSLPGSPPGGPVVVVPDGSPAYLTVTSVSHDRASGVPPSRPYHPLSAKNTNLFTVPYGDAADATVEQGVGGPTGVRLRTAGHTLIASESISNGSTPESRRRLRESVDVSMAVIRARARRIVRNETQLTRSAARAAVDEGVARWDGTGRRALAASNGSLAAAIAAAADARASDPSERRRERLETRLDAAFVAVRRTAAARTAETAVNETLTRVRERATERAISEASDRVRSRYLNGSFGRVAAGLPVAPVPGYWYATVNVWDVSVRGAYARFTLRTRRGAPASTPGAAVRYVRDGSAVRLDVDGDGAPERLGHDERVAFETGTVVAVAVPAYRGGVGDVDGNADERAGTWPEPRCTSWEASACRDSE
ncbi:hypothetical protein DU500_08750 [Haloplanus rubicundus]|uniref:Uncharacterized protein n=1 Tax=Haloplanus rubicundus TaxID=1547898 RepID=A0A345E2T0_9EURY|nr:hypothetical protein DU500_08750 [Haloplanus rubicundus]